MEPSWGYGIIDLISICGKWIENEYQMILGFVTSNLVALVREMQNVDMFSFGMMWQKQLTWTITETVKEWV